MNSIKQQTFINIYIILKYLIIPVLVSVGGFLVGLRLAYCYTAYCYTALLSLKWSECFNISEWTLFQTVSSTCISHILPRPAEKNDKDRCFLTCRIFKQAAEEVRRRSSLNALPIYLLEPQQVKQPLCTAYYQQLSIIDQLLSCKQLIKFFTN